MCCVCVVCLFECAHCLAGLAWQLKVSELKIKFML